MGILRKHSLLLLLICLFCLPVHADLFDWLGGKITGWMPVELKDGAVLKQQYDELTVIKEQSKLSKEELQKVQASAQESNKYLKELQKFIDNPDKIYRLATDARYRDEYLLSFSYRDLDGNENPAARTIVQKLYRDQDISLRDLEKLCRLETLDEEDQLIRQLQDSGVSKQTIVAIVRSQRENRERKEKLKLELVEKTKVDTHLVELESDLSTYENKYNQETNQKLKTDYKALAIGIENNLHSAKQEQARLGKSIDDKVKNIRATSVDLNIKGYNAALKAKQAKQSQVVINSYYLNRSGTSGSRMSRFNRFIERYFI